MTMTLDNFIDLVAALKNDLDTANAQVASLTAHINQLTSGTSVQDAATAMIEAKLTAITAALTQ